MLYSLLEAGSLCSALLSFHLHFHTLYLAFHRIGTFVELAIVGAGFTSLHLCILHSFVLVRRMNRSRRRSARIVRQGWLACLAGLFLSNCVVAAMAAQYRLKDW